MILNDEQLAAISEHYYRNENKGGGKLSIEEVRDMFDTVADLKRQVSDEKSSFADALIWITRQHEIELTNARHKGAEAVLAEAEWWMDGLFCK